MAKRTPSVNAVHRRLRQDILRGRFPPGSVISQVQLASAYGVSRTPLREAMRMLQEEGLLHAEANRRARVAAFDLDDLEAISAQRILAAALATQLTTARMDSASLAEMGRAFDALAVASAAGDAEAWYRADVKFHSLHFARGPELLLQDMRRLRERNNVYRVVWLRDEPHLDARSEAEHRIILEACRRGDPVEAAHGIARHYGRIALTVMTSAVPEREPLTIRTALQIALGVSNSAAALATPGPTLDTEVSAAFAPGLRPRIVTAPQPPPALS
jgi:DNA-binding GntR family transcriptional regulator